jgi:HAD superfamily hydrolase (TIGR01509 family)
MPFTRPVAGVIFDMDGLLLDTERLYLDGLFKAAIAVERVMTQEFALSMIGVPGKECNAMIEAHYGEGFSIAAFSAVFNATVEAALERDIPLRPGARELVAYLAAEGIPQAIATSARRASVQRYIGQLGLLDHFAAIVSREDVENPKPAPDPFLAAAAKLGVPPADCVALEDSHHGITAAHAAGMMTIMVPDLLPATDAVRMKCIAVADDLHAVGEWLRQARASPAASARS